MDLFLQRILLFVCLAVCLCLILHGSRVGVDHAPADVDRVHNSDSGSDRIGRHLHSRDRALNGAIDADALDADALEQAKVQLRALLSLIYRRYEFDTPEGYQLFMASNNLNAQAWEVLRLKFSLKILADPSPPPSPDTPSAPYSPSTPYSPATDSTFLMIFSGSSVTAGHDSYFNQSYPLIVQKHMGPILRTLGVQLVVHNIAQGANNCIPYTLCYESMGGFDPDFVNWEQSYNCGHEEPVFEAVARLASMSARKAIAYYSASGAWSPSQCPPANESLPYCEESWTPSAAGLEEWEADQAQLEDFKQALFRFNSKGASYSRFTNAFRNDYKGVPLMGFNVWEVNGECNFQKNGKTEHCNGIDAAGGCQMKFMSKEASYYGSDNKQGANWHPTRAFHMLRGESIAWIFALVLLEAVEALETALPGRSRESLREEYLQRLDELTPPPPKPKRCGLPLNCERRARCFTDYGPHYTGDTLGGLGGVVVGQTLWEYDDSALGEWSLHYGYLDMKPKFWAKGSAQGEIHIRVTINGFNAVWLCGENKDRLSHIEIMLDADVPEAALANYSPREGRRLVAEEEMAWRYDCREVGGLPQGTHVLSVSSDGDATSSLTHVITWPHDPLL